ncbi:MAG: redoxin domain-containing protein [Chlorobi bacterium]|nr:redoxin domain-containing protein [Chlorobiota bacterium]
MKNLIYILAVTVLFLQSCGSSTSQANDKNNEENGIAVNNTANAMPGQDKSTAKGGTTLLTKDAFLKKVWNYETSPKEWKYLGDKPAIVDFYADWCAPCRKASPILEQVSKEYAGKIHVYKIDTQKEKELAAVFGVKSIPAFLYIPKNGKPTIMSGIGRTDEATKKMFIDNIDKYLLNNN